MTAGIPESRAWSSVLEAIAHAIDVDELPVYDRGRLAKLYEDAQ
jgi:hypothetical protein